MPSCCRICEYRQHAIQAAPSSRELLDVTLVTLSFKSAISPTDTTVYTALNTLLNNIIDSAETACRPTSFTAWSPCQNEPHIVAVLTTANETCKDGTSPVFETVLSHLSSPPSVQHVYLDHSVISLAASSPETKIPCDIFIVRATKPEVAGAIGKRFGWDPKRSKLSARMGVRTAAAFSRPGDLVRDFWAWAELPPGAPISSSSSIGSGYESTNTRTSLISTNSEENISLFSAEQQRQKMEDERLVMIFQWSSRVKAERFKHPFRRSYGQNGQEISGNMWRNHVAYPLLQLSAMGAELDVFKLELRGVEPRMDVGKAAARERRGSRRLSSMALGFGERISGLWSR